MTRCHAAARACRCALPALMLVLLAGAAGAATLALPADAPSSRTVALQEVWRLGGDNDSDPLLGVVTGGARDTDGSVYLVDRQLSQVLVIAPDGTLVRTLGREGDGPGEMRQPHSIVLTPRGVGVVQGFPGKIVFLDRDGTPAGETRVGGAAEEGGFRFVRQMAWAGDRLVGAIGRGAFDMEKGTNTTTSSISVLNDDGSVSAEIAPNVQTRDFQKFTFDEAADWAEYQAWCVGADGRIYSTAARDRWAVNVRDLKGDLLQTWERPFTPRKRDAKDKEEIGSDMRIVMNGRRVEPEVHALDTDAAIAGMHAAADGRIFVVSCWDARKRLEKGTAARYDVLAPDGRLLDKLTLTFAEFDPANDALLWLDGTHFLVIRNYEDAQRASDAGDDGAEPQDAVAAGEAEPLELVLVRLAS